jgi:D-xylose transport system permease protein
MAKTDIAPPAAPLPASAEPAVVAEQYSLKAALSDYVARVRGGELGALPAVLGFVVLFATFSVAANNANFLSNRNFANLLTQATPITIIGIGVVFVLLLGEIDLSAGATAGVCAVSMAWFLDNGWPGIIAIPMAVVIGLVIGLLTGFLVARVGIPSFVVTLAFFLSWQGVVLMIAKEGGTIGVTNDVIVAIANRNLAPALGWVLWALIVAGYAIPSLLRVRERQRNGLAANPYSLVLIKTAAIALLWGIATALLNKDRSLGGGKPLRGVPISVPVVIVLVVILTYALSRTKWGRHIYAVGGNAEAARRAGINVRFIRISGFMMCSSVAAIGGMALASQLNSVSPQTGGNDTVLLAVAAAVIGGTSLFGGRGRVIDAVIGGLVVAIIPNGMGLLGSKEVFGFQINFSESGPKFIVTGFVLLLAASVDALSRKRTVVN